MVNIKELWKKKIYLADLTHTARGISASVFPLGTAFVSSYAQKVLGDDFEIKLFKFPEQLCQMLTSDPPLLLCLSNYSWNLELSYKLGSWAKKQYPNLIVVFGGPNFPILMYEKIQFLKKHSIIDFYIHNEGELGFVDLVRRLQEYKFNAAEVKKNKELIINCNYLSGEQLIEGPFQRIEDINIIPSPYLNGTLDEFFNFSLSPMIETTRGCPFTCAYCSDGAVSKNKVVRFEHKRIRDELHYISKHIKNIDELIITDLNFGMYKEDVTTARYIAEVQKQNNWPVLISGSAGKNATKYIIETATILGGSWLFGAAIQSSDKDVLKNIKRNNISLDTYQELLKMGNNLMNGLTYTEVILGLPGDTKKKHFESLRYGIENQASSIRMYQAMLLSGTDMAKQETRVNFGLLTKFRIIPGCMGVYKFGDENTPIAEIEEIIVGSKYMTFEDYVSCRVMNLIIETYINNALFEEIFSALGAMDISTFDCLVYLHEHDELYTSKMKEIFKNFISSTKDDLYDSYEEAEKYVFRPEIMKKYVAGELGINELLVYKAELYLELEDISAVLLKAVKNFLREENLLNDNAEKYFEQLTKFILCMKKNFHKYDEKINGSFNFDFKLIDKLNYKVDPRKIKQVHNQINFKFFHKQSQTEHIKNCLSLYENTPSAIGRMIQRTNLKKMYRHFEQI